MQDTATLLGYNGLVQVRGRWPAVEVEDEEWYIGEDLEDLLVNVRLVFVSIDGLRVALAHLVTLLAGGASLLLLLTL